MRYYFLAKFFEKKEWADEFLQGKLFLNSLRYFKEIEGKDGRGDDNEGAIFFSLEDSILTLGPTDPGTGDVSEVTITKNDLAAPMSMHPYWYDHINLLCMYACHTGDFQHISDDNINDFRKHIEIPEECVSLGEYAIIINDGPEFLRRTRAAAELKGYRFWKGLVTYHYPEAGTPTTGTGIEPIFHKLKEYEYQSEYRIAVDAHLDEPTPKKLSIGDISDIAFLMRTSEINQNMSFEVRPR